MELYLSACSKAANVASTKTATSGPSSDSQQKLSNCIRRGAHKTNFPVGAAQLLDLPLGVKLPVIPGSKTLYYTTKLSEKLFRPSYGFNLTDPYCQLLENQYKSLHDPHLRAYHKRKDILRRLKKGGYITSNNKIVCTLRELNKYRQYLTSLKLDFERNYIREQKMLAKQVNKLQENSLSGCSDVAQFQNWLLKEGQSVKDQERLIRHRYLDMISRELEQLERTAEEQRLVWMDREERRQREYTRRKLSLRRKIEEEWKTKEMLLLTKIGEDVKREARIEEQRRRSREESDRKKQALLEKKMAYHLQKMQDSGIKREDMKKNIVDYREQDGLPYESYSPKKKKKNDDDIKLVYHVGDQKANKGILNKLNSIIQNIMTWVVATVTSILYPAITKYEERLKINAYPVSDESFLSSDSSSFCSTCSEVFTYGSYTSATTKTFQREPCAFEVDISVRQPTTPLRPPSAHVEKTVVGKTYNIKGQSVTSELKYNKTSMIYTYPKIRSCKSDSHLLSSLDTGTKISKDATTETDGLASPLFSDQKAKATSEMKSLKNVFVNFKCHLKGETELILESIFQEIMSDLTQAIPSISSVTAEVFVDQSEPEKGDLISNVDICSVASEIVENMLEKLQSAVEKKCVQIFSQEDLSVNIKPSLTPSGESLTPSYEKPLAASFPQTVEPMCDIAEDMVHAVLEKLVTLTSCKQNQLPHLEDATKLSCQQHLTDPAYMLLTKADKKKGSPEHDSANLIVREEIKNLMSHIFSQSSLVGYIEEAISTILGYVQTELNNERLIASEETVVFLQLLNDIFTQLRLEPIKENDQKCRHSRLRNNSDTEEKYRLTDTRLSNGPRSGKPFPPVNVPGMVLYSEDDNEEIDKTVENVLDSSFKDEKAKSQEQIPDHWFIKGNTFLEYKRNSKTPTKPTSPRSKALFRDQRLKTKLPSLKNKKKLKEKHCLDEDILFFSQDQNHQIHKASENIVKSILTEMLKDISPVPPGHLDSKTGKQVSVLVSEKPQGQSHQEWMDQMFSVSEISAVAQEITDAVLNILHKASCIPNITKSSISSSVHQTSLECSDTLHMVKEAPNKKPLKIWFDSEKKMKYLSSLDVDPAKPSMLKSEESEPKPVDDITDNIVNTVFKRLKLFVCPKLKIGFKPTLADQSSLQSQLSAYTTKVVNIVLHAIQNELEPNKKSLNLREADHTKSLTGKGSFADNDKLESLVSNINDDSMTSPLLTCICEMLLSGHSDKSSMSLCSDSPKPTTSYGSDNVDKQNILPNRQDKKSFYKIFATPCALHSVCNGKDLKEKSRLQVLDNIGETLFEMLYKFIGAHPHHQPSCSKLSSKKMHENQQTATELQSNIQLISTTILECILAKLCSFDMDTSSLVSSGFKAVSKSLDIDSLSFTSVIEEMAKCTDIISSIVSRMVQEDNKETTKSKEKTVAPMSSKTECTKEMHSNKLKSLASDILNTVFAKLEGFANGNLETLGSINDKNKRNKMGLECENPNVFTETLEELLQSALYTQAKKVSSTILKAIQRELNMNSSDLKTGMKTPPPEKQMLENVVNLILDAVSSDVLDETGSEERGIETYRYRPTYGNFLPGGAESDSFLEEAGNTEKEFTGDRPSLREETKSDSFQQCVLERTLNKIEMKLKEPQKSPVVPIIRTILNEIFQSALVSQLNVLSLSHSHFSGIPHNADDPVAQTDKMIVSEADVTIVAEDVVRTVFHKLYSAALTERSASENRYKTVTFSANVSFHKHACEGGKSSITVPDENSYTLQSRFSIDQQAKVNIVEDIVQAILTSLETFATSKVISLFYPQINFTVPMALPIQQDKSTLNKALSAKDLHSEDQFSGCLVDHVMSKKTNSLCQLSLNKLNTYATEVARKMLQGIKRELDKERESPYLTHNIVVSESITSQVVNTVLDIVSSKVKCGKNNSDKETELDQQEGIIEKLFNKTEYRKVLQFQIQDTVESILCDIYEKRLYQNNLSFAKPTLKCSLADKHGRTNSEMFIEGASKILPKLSVPKSDVILISNDIVDIVLHNLSSAIILGINAKDSNSVRLPLTFCDMFPKVEYQQPLLTVSKSERKSEYFSSSKNLKSCYTDDSQITAIEKDPKKSVHDPYEEHADFITKTIFNRLESFATERIDSLITLAFQPKEKPFVNTELENCKQDDSIFHQSSQVKSNVNILKNTTETILCQELTDSTFASYRERLGSTVHLLQTSLKEYADIIATAILKLIKNDLDHKIQKMHSYPNNLSFQEIIIVNKIVNSILKILHDKRSVKEISFYSKDSPNLFSQLTMSDEILLGQRPQEINTKLSLFSKNPLEQNQMALEMEGQRIVLKEIFMRNKESKQKEGTALFSAVEEVLNKVHQRIMELIGHMPSFNEIPNFISNSKIKTADITQKNFCQSHIKSVANDTIETVLGKMYSVVVTSLYGNNKVETADKNDILPKKCIRETKKAGIGSNLTRYVLPQIYPYAGSQNASLTEKTFLRYSPLQVGKDLVQMVLSKITNFVSLYLEETLSYEGYSDELQPERVHSSKVSPKDTPKLPSFKTSLKAKSKVTPLPKFRTKAHLGRSHAKAKSKTKLGPREKTPKESWSKTSSGLPHILSMGDAGNLLQTKLPTIDLKTYSKDIVSNILRTTVKEFEKVKQTRAIVNDKALPSDQIMVANKIVNTVLQGLYATNNHNLANPIKFSHLDDPKLSRGNIGTESLAKTQACFYLENVSSQLEQIFPKEGIFKKMFDKWQAESNDMENEKCKLLMIAENVLTEISIKTKELEYSLSLLHSPYLEDCGSRFNSCFKGVSTRTEDTKAQINMFGREIVEMLFEKLQLCFLSQMPTPHSKDIPANRNEQITTKSKYGFPTKDILSNVPIYDTKTKQQSSLGFSNQIVREIVERVLNMLESFVDLQFKHISKYEFSEIVKMPIENLFPVQQRLLSKKMLPKLQPLKKFANESKSSTGISKDNVQNTLLHVHSFHSELFTYAVNIVSDMFGIIKDKLDREISQAEPSSVSTKENIAASEIIGTLMDQCTHFNESLTKNLPNQSFFQREENTYIVNQVELATNMKMSTSEIKEVSFGNNPPQISVPEFEFYSEKDREKILPSFARTSIEDTIKSPEPMERLDLENTPSCSKNKVQDFNPRGYNLAHFDQAMKGNSSLPEGSILQKLLKKAKESTETALKQVMSFIEMRKSENPRVFHYEISKPIAEPNQIQTTVSPLKICLAAENIVSTVLSSYGFPSQPHINESTETMKPFFLSRQKPLSALSGGQKNEKSLLRVWDKRISYIPEEENKKTGASRGDFSLLQKWEDKTYLKIKTLKKVEVIAFADHELGPNEIHLIARHVTSSMVTYFKNFETTVSSEEKVCIVSTLSRKKCESKQPLRSIYSDSSLYQFCESLADSVICHLISSISDSTKDGREKEKAWERQNAAFNTIVSIDSQVFESRSVSVGELALSISEIITEILLNSNIIQTDIAQQMSPLKTKYIYCPGVTAGDFDDLFQDLLVGVIHVLSKEIGLNHHLEITGINKPFSMIRSNSMPTCNKKITMQRQTGSRDWKSSTHQMDHIIQKNKLNYLAYKLDSLAGSLKTHESKEVVNKVFSIVLDLFLPDEQSGEDMDSDKARRFLSSSNQQQSSSILGNNLGLTAKSVFLLNVVCEKLIRTLLEKCTNSVFLDNSPLSEEISAEECKLLKILQSIEETDYCKGAMDHEQFQADYMSDILENMAEIDQDLLSSDSVLNIICHSLVKSLMDKLSQSIQLPQSPPSANRHSKYGAREIESGFINAKTPELTEFGQGKVSLGLVSCDCDALIRPVNNPSAVSSKIHTPFGKKYSANFSVSPLNRQGTQDVDTVAINNKLYPGDMNTGVYSATFLEEIISELFFNLCISLWGKDENITEAHLHEMNALFVNNVVNEFNKARVTVLRNSEERLCFPPVHKETVCRIVDSVYYDVLQQYKLKVSCGNNPARDNTSIAEQITNSILLEILDYQLPSCFRGKLLHNSYHSLNVEIILQKLQNNLREFAFQPRSSKGYSTMLSHSFLEGIIRRLLSQLITPPSNASYLKKIYITSSDFNEMSTCIINKIISAISKHKIWFTIYDNQYLCTGKNLQKMVDSVYSNIVQTSDSLVSIQKSIVSRSPIMVDRIASFVIQEIIENHLQPFLCGEDLPRPETPSDAISNMVKQVLKEVIESHRPQTPLPSNIYSETFVGEIVARLLSKIFSPKHNTEIELENITQKIVNLINNHFDKAKVHTLYYDKEESYPSVNTDIVDELVTSVYRNVLKQHGLDPEVDKETKDSDIFVEKIANLVVAAIADYLLHPLFSGDLSSSSYSISAAENVIQDVLSNISRSDKPSQSLSPYNTLLPYTFLEDMIRVLLSKFFPSASSIVPNREPPKDRSKVNFNEIASNIISDIRMKISQHEIRFSREEEETRFVYSEDDVQHLVDSVFKNISQNFESQESVEQNITSSNDVLTDRIAGFIIKHICQQHLQPFMDGNSLPTSSCTYFSNERREWFYTSVYSSMFLEDVVSGVLSKIFHRVLGIVQTKSVRESEDELFDKAEKLIYFITEEFSKAQISILENAEEKLCLTPVKKDVVRNIIDMVYSKVLQEHEMEITPDKGFLNDIKTLATRIAKIILAKTFDFQIDPNLVKKLPFGSQSKLNTDILIKKVHCDITKSRLQRQSSAIYSTMLSHTHLEKIVSQLMSQMSPLASSTEYPDTSHLDLSNTVKKLINEIMSIISKHAICIIKHGNEKQSMMSEKDIQSIVDSIYADLSYSNICKSLTKDKKGISNIPVSKIASFIIKEIFNHHLQSFLSGDKTLLSATVDQTYKQEEIDCKQKDLSFIGNSAVFLEEVISELLCRLLYAFSHVLAAEDPNTVKAEITGIVTTLVKSIVLEFTTSEILLADNFDDDMCFPEGYKEMVQKTVNLIYEKILDEYKSLVQVYRAIQSNTVCFARKIYNLLLEEIYDYQVQSLVSGKLVLSSCSSPRADKIIRNVLSVITRDSHALPSCITVLPRSLLEDMIYKLLVHIFPSIDTESELQEEEVPPDDEFVDAASKLTDEIIKEISEHEIHLAYAEENAESMQLEVTENLVDSICNNIFKKSEFQAEVKKDTDKKGGSFLSKIAGFIMKEIMDYHLQPFLHGEESSSSNLSNYDYASVHSKPDKEKRQPSLYSATFLEDVIVDLVHKFYSLPSISEDSKKKETPEPDIVSLAIEFANSLIGEFRKSEIKVLPNAEEMLSFPPIDKETIDKISNFVYDQFIGKYGSNSIQKEDKNNIVQEMIVALAQKAISAFKIQPLFSGDWSSTLFSFLNPDDITQRVKQLPHKTSIEINRCLKENQPETSMKRDDIQDPVVSSVTRIMKNNMVNLLSGSGVANKKENENKVEIPIQKYNLSKVTYPTTSVKSKDTHGPDLRITLKNNEIEKKIIPGSNDKDGQVNEVHSQFLVATDDKKHEKEILGQDFEIDSEKKIDKTRENSLKKDKVFKLSSLTSIVRNTEPTTEKILKTVTKKPNNEEKEDFPAQTDKKEGQYSDYESVENVIENIYDNILEMYHSQESADYSKLRSLPSSTALPSVQEVDKDSDQSDATKDLSLSIKQNLPAKEKKEKDRRVEKREREKVKVMEIKKDSSKSDSPHSPPKGIPGFLPAKFLEDVVTEMVNKLIFSSSAETQTYDRCQNVSDDKNQAELYDTAMKLIDSLLKEFSDAQIKAFRPDEENQFFSPADKVSSVPKEPPRHKESNRDEASSNIKKVSVDNMHTMTEKPSSNRTFFLDKISSTDKTLVNKVVHASVCNILKEYRSQDSICKNIKSNGGDLARRLTSAVINEIFQHKLNLILCDKVPASSCLPLETKDIVKKVQKFDKMASKESQTSSPYTIMLPHEFLENVISALLSKIFSTVSSTKAETSEGIWLTELDFLQMKLLSTVTTEISKDEAMIIQYVESLHPNDDEIIQLVVQSLYNNLLSQFGSQEIVQNCVVSGCIILSETIVDLIVREVTGNQLQNYFSGELTPKQCTEVDSVVENILKDVIQTADVPQTQLSHARILPYNIIEEITVKFLSKLLYMFPKVDKERPKSIENEMQKITSKILNSLQEFISKSKIKVISPAKELPSVPLADNETIEKVVNSVYSNILKHSGSHISIFKDLMGKSNVLSDIIGFLMVKEISGSEFQPQAEEELSSSELVLEAVKIMEKVVKMVDEFKSQEKSSSKKGFMLDATFLEEALALFLAKIVRLPRASSKHAKNLSKPELNKIASQLTKSVTAEISKSNINLVAAESEEHILNPESIEMISQVIDSIYSNVLQQSGTHAELYYDIKNTNRVFPKKVASLIISGVSDFPLDTISLKNSNVGLFGDLDINRIVQKAQEHAIKMIPDLDKIELERDSIVEDSPIKIVPHVGNKPLKIDPNIISEHLAVISIKTQPLEKLKMECLQKTGHSIEELRRASVSGRSYSSDTFNIGQLKRERRTSLNSTGRLDVKPFEAVCRNSFQNIRKPDITKVELLKDVQNKKELIIRLVAHDIDQEISESNIEEELMSDEDEVVLRQIVQEEHIGGKFEDQVKEAIKLVENKVVSPKPTQSTSSLKNFFSLSKCCQPTYNPNVENTEATSNHVIEPKNGQVKRTLAEHDMATCSRTLTETDPSWEEKPQRKKEEENLITEPTHYFIHRIMSSSSYNQEDLISHGRYMIFTLSQYFALFWQFITIFEGNENILGSVNPSKEVIPETFKPSISKQGSNMLARISSALSKVFSRTNTNISRSSSPPHLDEQ
uniref:Fibrous sheath interacting protein 2 n=1 Tax=Catagonus wagneri TaxID=51154 RepID=A0A8C3W6W1_9CETA